MRNFADDTIGGETVRGFLHQPGSAAAKGLVLTHSAGSSCRSPLLVALAEAFCGMGWIVLRCDLPFRQQRPHGPPPRGHAERDQAGLRAALAALRRIVHGRVFLGGHSYGGRQASMLAATDPEITAGLLLLSYPLHPPQRPDVQRTAHLPDLRTPALFVHGSEDGFGSLEEIRTAMQLISAPTALLPVPGAGHELAKAKRTAELARTIAGAFARFVRE